MLFSFYINENNINYNNYNKTHKATKFFELLIIFSKTEFGSLKLLFIRELYIIFDVK